MRPVSYSEDNLRSGCDMMNVFFVIDEYTDKMDAENTKMICDASMDAILHPDRSRPEDETLVGEISRQ